MAKANKKNEKPLNKFNDLRLDNDKLRWSCPEDLFSFKTTKELTPLNEIVGQPRAIDAIKLGATLQAKGYNIFVTGLSGTGRLTTVKSILENITLSCPITYDYCYVNNFKNEDEPRLIKLPKGKAREFAKSMDDAITFLRRRLPKLFEEESYQQSKRKIIEEYQLREKKILEEFDERILPFGFLRGQLETEQGSLHPEVFPIIEGKAVAIEVVDELVAEGKLEKKKADSIKDLWRKFHNEIFELAREGMKIMQEFRKALADNDKNNSEIEVKSALDEVRNSTHNPSVEIYLNEVLDYILNHLNIFVPANAPVPNMPDEIAEDKDTDFFRLFTVNVILDNSETNSAPVIIETTPSYSNLFGTIERVYDKRGGYWRTDFTKIKAGSLLKADQGYLIVNANDLFSEAGVWTALKRVLLYDKLEIQNFDAYFQFSQASLKPEPVNVNLKVIIIGGLSLYHMLFHYEKGFKKIFKVHAQFDYETARTNDLILSYARFINKVCQEESLPHCEPSGVAAIVEWAVEASGNQNRITLKFSDVADILREAAYFDGNSQKAFIGREEVEKAIESRRRRNDLLDEKIKYQISEGTMLIDTSGERIGQINGLTVYNNGFISFGKPARITAIVTAGNNGIINIEREADLSGAIHNKGVLIISSFLRDRFASNKPLSLTASIAFEQSYGGIDGDSASAAEIYILLSALSGLPIKQSIAVTGSVNQKGDIQPIGGVNEKITGFYEVCKERGLDGNHGVIIPIQNVKDLMLPNEIIKDVKNGLFNIWAISTVEQGAEILMACDAGTMNEKGEYTKDSIFYKAHIRLEELRKFASLEKVEKKTKKKTAQILDKEDED